MMGYPKILLIDIVMLDVSTTNLPYKFVIVLIFAYFCLYILTSSPIWI